LAKGLGIDNKVAGTLLGRLHDGGYIESRVEGRMHHHLLKVLKVLKTQVKA